MVAKPRPSASGAIPPVTPRRGAGLILDAAAGAVEDQQLVGELRLRTGRRPWLAGLVERRDPVLVAVDVAGLDPDDERHVDARVGGRGRDVGRRVRRVVGLKLLRGRVRRLVEVGEARRLVALGVDRRRLALPWLQLRPREHRTAAGMVAQRQSRSRPVGQGRAKHVASEVEMLNEPDEAVAAAPERARHVALAAELGIDGHLDATRACPTGDADRDQCLVAADQVGAAGEHRDREAVPPRALGGCRERCDHEHHQPEAAERPPDAHRGTVS